MHQGRSKILVVSVKRFFQQYRLKANVDFVVSPAADLPNVDLVLDLVNMSLLAAIAKAQPEPASGMVICLSRKWPAMTGPRRSSALVFH
jgi:hypothetical protein